MPTPTALSTIQHGDELRAQLRQSVRTTLQSLGLPAPSEIVLERPADPAKGDLASPVALQILRTLTAEQRGRFATPVILAEAIAQGVREQLAAGPDVLIDSIEAAAPGFVNFRLSQTLLWQRTLAIAAAPVGRAEAAGEGELIGTLAANLQSVQTSEGATTPDVIIEYVSPNTNKPLHIGHLRNAALGWSLSQLLAAGGARVQRAVIFNDRGLHIMKSCWAYLAAGRLSAPWQTALVSGELTDELIDTLRSALAANLDWRALLAQWQTQPEQWLQPAAMRPPRLQKSDHFIGFCYQLAERFAQEEFATVQWAELLRCWENETEAEHAPLRQLWQRLNDWFYDGFEQTRQRFNFVFDPTGVSYESQIYQKGKQMVVAAADQGILARLPDGAIIARLEAAQLPDKVLLRRDGTGIYMTFDIALTQQRTATNAQQLIWVVGADQKLSFQQLFAIAELLGYGQQERYHHLAYGMVRLPEGKMSSRKGLVIYADDLLDLAVSQARSIMEETGSRARLGGKEFGKVAEAIGIGAIKWTMLAADALSEITFDLHTSVNFKGFAGPYIQYTHARCRSVLRQAESSLSLDYDQLRNSLTQNSGTQAEPVEIELLRSIYTYYEIVRQSQAERAPHLLCNYLYQLCQSFNGFYAACSIIADPSLTAATRQRRLALTQATAQILAQGLTLLGITAVERM